MTDQEAPHLHRPHCLICGELIPEDRAKKRATTCSDEHRKERKARLLKHDHHCKCIWCGNDVPRDRERYRAMTCTEGHRMLRKASLRARVDQRQCRVCRKPSTPTERAAFRRFRSLEITVPELLYPKAWKLWQEQSRGDLQAFHAAIAAQLSRITGGAEMGGVDLIDLGLIDFRSKEAPGGAKSGRKRIHPRPEGKDAQAELEGDHGSGDDGSDESRPQVDGL